jgi:hypothetical protein
MSADTPAFAINDATPLGYVNYNGVDMPVSQVPNAVVRALMGHGHFPDHGRAVVAVPGRQWPHTPETCLTENYKTEWLDPETLVCQGCGLDVS